MIHDIWSGRDLASRALANGARRVSLTRIEWDIAGNCMKPYCTEYASRPPADASDGTVHVGKGRPIPITVAIDTRCRRCAACLKVRQRLWSARARMEYDMAPRTWFGTLTLNPAQQLRMLNLARRKCAAQLVDFETLHDEEQFRLRHEEISREITLYLKRCRKRSKTQFRYLFVAEKHQSGDPHYHYLIHEKPGHDPMRYSVLSEEWKLGFSTIKLAPDRNGAGYLCKYLAKSAVARVRASVGYGSAQHNSKNEMLRETSYRTLSEKALLSPVGNARPPSNKTF